MWTSCGPSCLTRWSPFHLISTSICTNLLPTFFMKQIKQIIARSSGSGFAVFVLDFTACDVLARSSHFMSGRDIPLVCLPIHQILRLVPQTPSGHVLMRQRTCIQAGTPCPSHFVCHPFLCSATLSWDSRIGPILASLFPIWVVIITYNKTLKRHAILRSALISVHVRGVEKAPVLHHDLNADIRFPTPEYSGNALQMIHSIPICESVSHI